MLPCGNEIYIISSFEWNEKYIDFVITKISSNRRLHIDKIQYIHYVHLNHSALPEEALLWKCFFQCNKRFQNLWNTFQMWNTSCSVWIYFISQNMNIYLYIKRGCPFGILNFYKLLSMLLFVLTICIGRTVIFLFEFFVEIACTFITYRFSYWIYWISCIQ